MNSARDEFLARPSLSSNENGRVGRSNFGNPIKHGLHRRRGTDDFLKHRGPVDFVPQCQIFSVELVFQILDLLEGFLQGSSVSILLCDIHGRANELDNLTAWVDDRMNYSVKVFLGSIR